MACAWLAAIGVVLVAAANGWVITSTADRVFTDENAVPANRVGLLLGTNGRNAIRNRTASAARLYHAAKVQTILVSGNANDHGFDEPAAMKVALMKLGVPERAIVTDSASLRTLDSMVRSKALGGLTNVTIITEAYHLNRALFLARHLRLEANGFCFSPPAAPKPMLRARVREVGARVKSILDIYLFPTDPARSTKPFDEPLSGRFVSSRS